MKEIDDANWKDICVFLRYIVTCDWGYNAAEAKRLLEINGDSTIEEDNQE